MIVIGELFPWSISYLEICEKARLWYTLKCDSTAQHSTTGDKIASCHTRKKYEITDIGVLHPDEFPVGVLRPGQVGYLTCNMKDSSEG